MKVVKSFNLSEEALEIIARLAKEHDRSLSWIVDKLIKGEL